MFDFPNKNIFNQNHSKKNRDSDFEKRYFISYRYDSRNGKPEIHINGNPVDFENFKEFFGDFKKFRIENPMQNLVLDAKNLNLLDSEDSEDEKLYEEPIYEIFEEIGGKELGIILELPGLSINNIIVSYFDDEVIITGESEDSVHVFRKELALDFIPDRKKTQISGKNGIFQIQFKKWA